MVWHQVDLAPRKEILVAALAYALFLWMGVAFVWALVTGGAPSLLGSADPLSLPYVAGMALTFAVSALFAGLYARDRLREPPHHRGR